MHTNEKSNDPSEDETQKELKALARRVTARFLVPSEGDALFSTYNNTLNTSRPPYDEIGKAFKANINGLISTVAVPFFLARAATIDRHYQRIFSSERIRSLMLDADSGESVEELETRREAVAREKADTTMDHFVASSEGNDAIIRDLMVFLELSLRQDFFAPAADELLLQGLVLCWGAFEVLARDIFIALLNQNPKLVELLLNDQVAKRRFEHAKFSIDTLATYNFDLSGKMGSFLAEQQDLSDFHSIKAVYGALYPKNDKLHDSLNDSGLRNLSLRRNLVVHRRGLIDELYIKNTSCNQKVGGRLNVLPADLELHVKSSIHTATVILSAIASSHDE